jgi:hypothetical protein
LTTEKNDVCFARVGLAVHPEHRGAKVPDPSTQPPAAMLTRALAWLVIALIASASVYALWIVAQNWSHIGV